MPLTEMQFLQTIPNAGGTAGVSVPVLTAFNISTPARASAFVAQVGPESANFTRVVENLNYSLEALLSKFSRSRITEAQARQYGRTAARRVDQVSIANCIYGGEWGRNNLGNTEPGDGWKFRGRSLIQVTGRANYKSCGRALGLDLLASPELLEQPKHAAMAAGWFWSSQKLNALADAGKLGDISSIINTGKPGRVPLGAEERKAIYQRALTVLT